jgi:PAS domain S-box-containing protein
MNADFLSGGGEMGRLMRAKRWADTPLGQPEHWPQSLKTVIRILLSSRYQMWMAWGDDLTFFCNDAYRPTLGVKQGWALGSSAREVWKEIWSDIGPRIDHVLTRGEATWDEGLLLFLERSGYPEETYHTFSYSPLATDEGAIVGMLCVVTEETERIIGERRLSSLRDLASEITGKNTHAEVLPAVTHQLAANAKDFPFSLIYLFDLSGDASLAGAAGVQSGHAIAPPRIEQSDFAAIWPAARMMAQPTPLVVGDLDRRVAALPSGGWDKAPRDAVVTPILRQGQDAPAGFFVTAINPYRRLDDAYLGFIRLFAGQIASGLANASAYEEERRRAEALAEIDRAKTAFFSNVSHEFRTPLTLMLGPLEDVLAKPEASAMSELRPLVQVAHRSGLRLLKLVNTLLDFSRIEAGRTHGSFEPVDLATLTADLASNFRSTIHRAGLALSVDCAPLPEPVYVDRDMWEKIVLNLLSNAFKFTFEGEIAVSLAPSEDGRDAVLSVRDTGTGIPAEDLPHLFERFRRVENARGRSIEGSGIGLALVQELVKLHGGAIDVQSEVGAGAVFRVKLAFGHAHLSQEQISEARQFEPSDIRAQAYVDEALGWLSPGEPDLDDLPPPSAEEPRPAAADRPLILLADDNSDMRNYLLRLLRGASFEVEAVGDGYEALVAARRRKPDLVLSDVMMPRLDGFGLLAELRNSPELRDTPVVLVSARAGEESKVEGLASGADDYLTKPFSARELLARVRSTLAMSHLRRDAMRNETELRRQAEMAQDRAETILASINDGFFALDQDWHFTYVNAAAERLLSQPSNALIGTSHWDAYPDLEGSPLEANYRKAMTERVSVSFENFYTPWDRWFAIRAYPARDGGLSVFFQDVTDRKHAETALVRLTETLEAEVAARTRELSAKEARLRTIFESSFAYQGFIALDGALLDANATSLSSVQAKLEDIVGKPFWETPWFTGTPGMPDMIRAALPIVKGGGTVRQEIHVNLPIGGWRWFDFQLRPVRDESGAVIAIVPGAVDISERKQAEETLRQAQKMESIGHLTGGVAHDFNNLLTIIVGNLETLQRNVTLKGSDVATMARLLDNAMRGSQRAASLTQHLLAFSRQQPLDPKPVELGRLVSGVTDLLRRAIGEHIAIETVVAGGLWRVSVDANQLENAILNLAVNARDAMPQGGRLTIEMANAPLDERYAAGQSEVAPGDYVMLAISDNGTGMSASTIARAFEPFFTTKDVGHGTGLGLSQVYGFVKQSGGHIKIYSELGEGTTIKIYLPRMEGEGQSASAEPVAAHVPVGRRGETILVVEDDEDVRAHTIGILGELGYEAIEASTGADALQLLRDNPRIKLLFTDVGLPGGMNGRQISEAAKHERPDLKVVFTTGYARNAIVHDGRLDPDVQLITKPFTFAALAVKLRHVLDAVSSPSRVLLVEDDVLIQMVATEQLEELGFEVEVAGSAAVAKSKLRGLRGDVAAAIVDVGLPDVKGDALVSELKAIYPELRVVIASGYDPSAFQNRFQGQSAIAFVGKPYSLDQLRSGLRSIGAL